MKDQTRQEIGTVLANLLNQILRSSDSVVGTEELARTCGYSRSHLSRMFHEMCGEPLSSLLRRVRLERAAFGLQRGTSVQEASALANFDSPESFCRTFKRAYGISPKHFFKSGLAWKLPAPDGLHWNEHWDGAFDWPTLSLKYETKLERAAPIRLAAIRHVGNYGKLWEGWEKVPFIAGQKWVTVYHDDIWTCPRSDMMRADLGFVLPVGHAPEGFHIVEIPGGLVVKTSRYVERTERNEAWSYLMGTWLSSGFGWDEYEDWPLPFEKVKTRACIGLA